MEEKSLIAEQNEVAELFGCTWDEVVYKYGDLSDSAIENSLNWDFPDLMEVSSSPDFRGRLLQNNAELAKHLGSILLCSK